jgi:hypothetical protein
MHLVESVLENRIIAPDSETRYGYPDLTESVPAEEFVSEN